MIEPSQSRFDEQLARFARGELTAVEERELAHVALESPAWFEELTATAMAKTAVLSVPVPAEPTRNRWWHRSAFLFAAAAVVVIGFIAVSYIMRVPAGLVRRTSPPARVAPRPTIALSGGSAQPVLLAEGLQPPVPVPTSQVFRGEEQPLRSPRQIGLIVEIEDGLGTINLGAADGLSKSSKVEIYRDKALQHRVGTLTLDTVFREKARGEIGGTNIKAQYTVRVSDHDHLQALLQAANDFRTRGDLTQARLAVAHAEEWARSAKVAIFQKAAATALLASLDFQAGELAAAETHYGAALEMLSADPSGPADEIAELQNNLAALAMLRGDYGSAEKRLVGGANGLSDPKLKAERLNNLGVLAEQRGDPGQAEALYSQAREVLANGSESERKVVEFNLNRVKGLR